MAIYELGGFRPQIGQGCYVAPSADLIGKVFLADQVSVWFGCVLRGDVGEIIVGEATNIQDLSVLHMTSGIPLRIGKNVTIGHKVTLHSCHIHDSCLIGMNSVILDGAEIGENSLVAAGTLVPPNKKFPPYSFIVGPVATWKRELTLEERQKYGQHYRSYLATKAHYLAADNFSLVQN